MEPVLRFLPWRPGKDGKWMGLGVEHPVVERNEVVIDKEQIQIFQTVRKRPGSVGCIMNGRHDHLRLSKEVTTIFLDEISERTPQNVGRANLGISSFHCTGSASTLLTLAYPYFVFACFSMASNTAQPRLRHLISPVVFQRI